MGGVGDDGCLEVEAAGLVGQGLVLLMGGGGDEVIARLEGLDDVDAVEADRTGGTEDGDSLLHS